MAPDKTDRADERSWAGFWSGIIWFAIGFLLIIATQISAVLLLAIIESTKAHKPVGEKEIQLLFYHADAIGISFLMLFPLLLFSLAYVIKTRRERKFLDYLAFNKVGWESAGFWLLASVVLLVIFEYLNHVFERPVPLWMLAAFMSTENHILFFLGVVILGPLSEEILYRGYIFRVWAESIIGPVTGSFLISLLWSLTHLQYDWFDMSMIFILGLLLCAARAYTGSIYMPMIIHIFWNLLSYIQVHEYANF